MSHKYVPISWNRQKRRYDTVLASGVVAYLALFIGLGTLINPHATAETLIIRAFGTCAILLLHIVLMIGPLCRLSTKFLPLLYNRRHLGVTTFFLGLVHGTFSLIQFHALGNVNPLVSLFISNTRINSLSEFPFQQLGFAALIILLLMAATSHDFWLRTLTPPIWKALHMLVYVAYGLLVAHVLLGALQAETNPALALMPGLGMTMVLSLHLVAANLERRKDASKVSSLRDEYIDVCAVNEIPESRARIVSLGAERIAVFRYGESVSAISNVCQHQNGPLGEGRVINGCVTCPWHGYQYLPDSGTSPPPFTEKVATYHVQIRTGRVFVHPKPNPPGTRVEPARIDTAFPFAAKA